MPTHLSPRHAALVAIAGAIACSPFEGQDGSGSSSGSSSSGGTVDGGPSPGADGGAPATEAGATEPCGPGSGATVCDTFERGDDVATAWTSRAVDAKGSDLTVQGGRVWGGVGALVTRMPTPCSQTFAQLVHEVAAAPARMQIRAQVAVLSAPTSTNVHLFGTRSNTRLGQYRVDVALAGDHLVLSENAQTNFTQHPATAKLELGSYARIEVNISFAAPARATVTVDGVTHIDTALATPELAGGSRFELGNYAESNCDKPTETWFDDVVYTLSTR